MKPQDDKNLFTAKFRDFGAVPSDDVWKGIEAALPEKKKKRFVVFWWTSGIAAVLVIGGLFLGNWYKPDKHGTSKAHSVPDHSTGYKNNSEKTFLLPGTKEQVASEPNDSELPKRYNLTAKESALVKVEEITEATVSSPASDQLNESPKAETSPWENAVVLRYKFAEFVPGSAVTTRNFPKTVSSAGKEENQWWIGLMAEQSNRFTTQDQVWTEPPASYTADGVATGNYYWTRIQTAQLVFGFDRKKWSFGTGLEYSGFGKPKIIGNNVVSGNGYAVGIPLFAAYRFYTNRYFSLGAQLDIRQRYLSFSTDSVYDAEVTSSPSASPQSLASSEFTGLQTQIGAGLILNVPFYNRFRWTTVIEYQYPGYRSSEIRPVINGSWLGVKTGILVNF
jgi:hypothetical protein